VAIARELDDPDLLLEAFHARIPGLQRYGDFTAMQEASEEVMRRYNRERHRDHAYFFGGHDARVCAQSFSAMALWGLGLFDQAGRMGRQCIEDARNLGHTFSIAHALHQSGATFMLLDDVAACQAIADELYPLAEHNKFPWPLTCARFLRGWVTARQGDQDAGIDQMLRATAEPAVLNRLPVLLTLVAEQQARAGRLEAVIDTLERAATSGQSMMQRFSDSEIARLHGDVLLRMSRANEGKAEALFGTSLAIAREQNCRAIELRAATSLARLRCDQGRRAEARDLLAPVYGSFTEGFGRPDLTAARSLLNELTDAK